MLKNKFGMTKVLVLVLSVLMLVSLAACNKKDTIDPDAMNSAIQSAIDAANAAQAEKDAALASSIAADKAAQAEKDAAIASSIAADKAAQEEELKKAQEAAAAASKQAAEASKQAAEASKQAAEASKEASKANTTVKTTKGEQTTAPIVIDDKTDVLEAYSKLKTEYTFTKRDYYLAADYSELVLLFDKASVDLNNALTLDAAKAVLETLKVDVAAIESAETAAKEVQALIAALGDIETEVFTTQAEKIVEARDALEDLKVAYADYFEYDVKKEADTYVIVDGKTINKTAALIEELGVEVDELENAESKLDVLEAYIAEALYKDMKVINNADPKHRFDVVDDAALIPTIEDAYYKYLVLSVLNGGDTAAADLPIDWEYKVDKDGEYVKVDDKKVYDLDKPIAWFTIEELVEVYILPTLDYEFEGYVAGLVAKFEVAMSQNGKDDVKSLYANMISNSKPAWSDIDAELDDVYEAFAAEVEALSFVEDYKGTATMADAQADANLIAIKAYINALNVYLTGAKEKAIEAETDLVEAKIETIEGQIDTAEDQISDTESETTIARLTTKIEGYKAQIETLNTNLEAYKANVTAAALLTFDEMLNEELNETKAYKDQWVDLLDAENYAANAAKIEKFLNLVVKNTIEKNFASEIGVEIDDESETELIDLINAVVKDLEALRLRVSPYEDDKNAADIFAAWNGGRITYVEDPYYYVNTDKFIAIVETIDAAIAEIEAVSSDAYTASNVKVLNSDGKKTYYYKDANAQTYAIENEWTLAEIINGKDDIVLVTTTATDFPVTYVYTAAEQASKAVVDLYVKAFQDVNAKIVALDSYAKGVKEKISKDGKTAYDLIAATVSGALKTEVEAVATKGKADIDAAVTKFANNCSLEAKNLFVKSDKWSGDADAFVTITPSAAKFASKYNPSGYKAKVDSAFTKFEKNFFLSAADMGVEDDPDTFVDESAVLDKTQSKVIVLWNAKLAAVKEITDAVAAYKNTYTALTGDEIGLYNVDVTDKYLYQYKVDSTKVAGKDAIATAYEAALDALLAEYTEYIMGVEIGDGETTITDGEGANVVVKDLNATGDEDDESYTFKKKKISYDLDIANAALNAYKAALTGTNGYWVTANNDAAKTPYNFGNSMIFKAYNTTVLNNAYGIARIRVDVAIEKVYNSAATTDGSVSISTPYYDNAITITASGVKTKYTEAGAVDKLGKAVKSVDVYKKAANAADWTAFEKNEDGTFTPDAIDASYKVVVTYVDEIVLENGGEYTEKDGVKTYTKGDLSDTFGFGAGTTVKVKVNGKDVKVGDTVVGKYYATHITVKVDGEALDADIAVGEDGYFTFDVEEGAESIVITPKYVVKPNISVSCGSGIKYYVVTDEENPVWLSGETYKIQLVLEDADADLEAKNGDAAITIAADNTISVTLTDTAAVAISVAVKAAE